MTGREIAVVALATSSAFTLGFWARGQRFAESKPETALDCRALHRELAEQRKFLSSLASGGQAPPGQECLTLSQLRSELRQLPADHATAAASASASASAAAAAEPTQEETGAKASDDFQRLFAQASSRQEWSEADATEFGSLLAMMTPSQRDKARSTLVTAVNEGRIKLGAHSPF